MGNEQTVRIHRGEFVPSRQGDDQITMNHQRRWRPDNDQSSVRSCREATDASLNLVGIAHAYGGQFDIEGSGSGLNRREAARPGGDGGIPNDRHSLQVRCDVLEQFQPFGADAEFIGGEPCDIAAGPCQAFDPSAPTGSIVVTNTIGTVRLACWNAVTTEPAVATTTSGESVINSAAYVRKRSRSFAPSDSQAAGCDPR